MNSAWLLRSRFIWSALGLSGLLSTIILLFSPDGLPALRKREGDLRAHKKDLLVKAKRNLELEEEVRRLASKDPELFEAMARKQGYAKTGETVYTFKEKH